MTTPTTRRTRLAVLGIDKGIGPLEAEVLSALARHDAPVTAREICDDLGRTDYFAYSTVLNCLNRLGQKKILERTRPGQVCLYRPLVDLEELWAQVVTNVLAHMGGDRDRVICRVLEIDPDVGAKKIAQLRHRMPLVGPRHKRMRFPTGS